MQPELQLIRKLKAETRLHPQAVREVGLASRRVELLVGSRQVRVEDEVREPVLEALIEDKIMLERRLYHLQEQLEKLEGRGAEAKHAMPASQPRGRQLSLRKLHLERQKREQRDEQRRLAEAKREEEARLKAEEEARERDKILKEARRQRIEQNLQKIKEREKERRNSLEQGAKQFKESHGKEALFVRLQREYQENVVKTKEREREQKLREIRMSQKMAGSLEEIKQHEIRYRKLLEEYEEERRRERQAAEERRYQAPEGSRRLRQLQLQKDRQEREQQFAKWRQYEVNKERQEQFVRHVKEDVKVRVASRPKRSDSEPGGRRALSVEQIKENGRLNLSIAKKLADHSRTKRQQQPTPPVKKYEDYLSKSQENPFVMRMKAIDRMAEGERTTQKLARLRQEADRLESQADSRSQLLKLRESPEVRQQIAGLLLNSIRAKTNMLKVASKH